MLGRTVGTSTRPWHVGLAAAVVLTTCSCGRSAQPPAAAETSAPLTDAPSTGPMMHGDHSAHYGGVVMMYGDLHFEVVLDPNGRHRVYFSDAYRQDLPASVVSKLSLTIERTAGEPEPLTPAIDESGESWVASGRAVADPDAMAKVSFVYDGEPYEIDVPFAKPESAPSTSPHPATPPAKKTTP
ncbi:MAG: hypothetical protein U0Q12_03630 [Vicinamibacterales bacterium]